ncbi:MAG: response regulator [Syntrophobacteraceae bacterium]
MKILVVDDEIDQLESLRRGLKSRGHSVVVARGAELAVQMLGEPGSAIDLMITDYAMPVLDGLSLIERIRKSHVELPIILMSAYGRNELVIEAMGHVCNGFIEKPFTLDGIMREIEKATTRPRGGNV